MDTKNTSTGNTISRLQGDLAVEASSHLTYCDWDIWGSAIKGQQVHTAPANQAGDIPSPVFPGLPPPTPLICQNMPLALLRSLSLSLSPFLPTPTIFFLLVRTLYHKIPGTSAQVCWLSSHHWTPDSQDRKETGPQDWDTALLAHSFNRCDKHQLCPKHKGHKWEEIRAQWQLQFGDKISGGNYVC